ncbi:MAG: HTH-type transcriptional repressor FabR [Ketobacteraceae bacterium]|nr:HTH-type transcriptional repressor FabR [Ketobacteraceae bacterium]
MSTRLEKKLKTRHNLMFGALGLVAQGQHFSTISIREVAKSAEVVPTSFYRHFTDMDDLGLALVDELSLILRQLMRRARQEVMSPEMIIRNSVDLFVEHVYANKSFFIFMSQELTGGSKTLRDAIRSELLYFANELSADMRKLHLMDHLPADILDHVCLQTIMTVAMNTTELLDAHDDPKEAERIHQRMAVQLRLLFLGAAHWAADKEALDKPGKKA